MKKIIYKDIGVREIVEVIDEMEFGYTFTSDYIAKKLDTSTSKVSNKLSRLSYQGYIKKININPENNQIIYMKSILTEKI